MHRPRLERSGKPRGIVSFQKVTFDAFEYAGYLAKRWRFATATVVAAVTLATVASLLAPARYTATASLLIDAPAGSDQRAATAVSPIYLESLKTYERFAGSATLFQRAIEQFSLPAGGSAESLKRRVLKVRKPRETRLLEIDVTLEDPRKAQAVAQFIAEQTVNLNRSLMRDADNELASEVRRLVESARARLDAVEQAAAEETKRESVESLEAEWRSLREQKVRLANDLTDAEADSAELAAGPPRSRSVGGVAARRDYLRERMEAVSARVLALEQRVGEKRARLDRVDADRRAARASYDSASMRLTEVQASAGLRGERLRIVDPGVVPSRRSSPNIPLNVLAAALVAVLAAALYLSTAFAREIRDREAMSRRAYTSAIR